jgi:hypothetical protein
MGFEASRQETNRQLRKDLARDKTSRTPEVKAIFKDTQNTLKGFETSRKEANVKLREDLSQGIVVIRWEVKEILGEVRKLIKGFGTSWQETSQQLRRNLSRDKAKTGAEVRAMRNGFQTSRRAAGSQLRRGLAQSQANMKADVKRMQSDFHKAQGNVKADLKEARIVWQGLAGNIQAGKGSTEIPPPPKAEIPATKENPLDLETKMLAAVNEHPEGMTLADIADSLGVAPVVLGQTIRSLVNKAGIRKEEKLYFPTDSKSEDKEGLHFRPPLR